MTSTNMYAYCGNNPINRADPNGTHWYFLGLDNLFKLGKHKPVTYSSTDAAARAFSEQIYSSSLYIRHEYSATINSKTRKGVTTYTYTKPKSGQPHSASVSAKKNTVAYIHTHPNSNVFSNADRTVAENLSINAYVVGPNFELQRYDFSSRETANLGVISPIALTDKQRTSLVNKFQIAWDNHVSDGCDFNCGDKEWPTP